MSGMVDSFDAAMQSHRHLRAAYLAFLHAMAFVWGAQVAMANEASLTELAIALTFAFAVVLACRIDATIAGKPIPGIIQLLMLSTWPLTAPGYLVWARRWRGLLWALLLCVTVGAFYLAGSITVMIMVPLTP